jgi:hypothetical protein
MTALNDDLLGSWSSTHHLPHPFGTIMDIQPDALYRSVCLSADTVCEPLEFKSLEFVDAFGGEC